MVFQLDIYTTWLPSLGIKPYSFSTSSTILLIGLKKLDVIVRCINHLQLNTLHYALRIRFYTNNLCHWPSVSLFLPLAILHPQLEISFTYILFLSCLETQRKSFCQWNQNSSAICCTCLHRLCEYRSGVLNTPGGGMITSLFMVRGLLGDSGISLLMLLRDSTVIGRELMTASVSATCSQSFVIKTVTMGLQ